MKIKTILLAFAAVLALTLYSIIQMDVPQAWAKGPAGKSAQTGVSSRVATPPMNTGASQGTDVRAKKKSSGDQLKYMEYQLKEVLISN